MATATGAACAVLGSGTPSDSRVDFVSDTSAIYRQLAEYQRYYFDDFFLWLQGINVKPLIRLAFQGYRFSFVGPRNGNAEA